MDVEATLERLHVTYERCPSPIDRASLEEAIETIEYLQDLVASLDTWIADYAYTADGSKA